MLFGVWIVAWLVFVLVFVLVPLGYGWGQRGWGPPLPSHYRGSRGRDGASGTSWGPAADVVWLFLLIGLVWLIVAILR